MDLIALGCFKGNEEMLRMTKGRTPEITIFYKDGSDYSYHFGEGSTTIISDNMCLQRELIRECAILDFGIVCDWSHMRGDFESLVKDTLNVRSLDDAARHISMVSGGGMGGHIRVNGQTMALDVNVRDVDAWFAKRGYGALWDVNIINGLPCGEVYGYCEPLSELDLVLDDARERSDKTTTKDQDNVSKLEMDVEQEIE